MLSFLINLNRATVIKWRIISIIQKADEFCFYNPNHHHSYINACCESFIVNLLSKKDISTWLICPEIFISNCLCNLFIITICRAVPWLRWLVIGLSLQRPRFNHRPFHVGFVIHKLALGPVFSSTVVSSC